MHLNKAEAIELVESVLVGLAIHFYTVAFLRFIILLKDAINLSVAAATSEVPDRSQKS